MREKLKRRDALKVAAATAGGLFLLNGAAPAAEPARNTKIAGEWLSEGDLDKPCAIFVHGRVLLLVNERGQIGVARLKEENKFVLLRGEGWEEGLVGEFHERRKLIAWKGGGAWKR
jgi:hypothetical protein